jgi:hypothetical protein
VRLLSGCGRDDQAEQHEYYRVARRGTPRGRDTIAPDHRRSASACCSPRRASVVAFAVGFRS